MWLSVVQQNIFCTCLSFNEHSLWSVRLNERYTRACLRETSLLPSTPSANNSSTRAAVPRARCHISLVPSFRRLFCDFSPTSRSFRNSCAGSTKDWVLLYSDGVWFGPRPRQRLFWQVLPHFPQVPPDKCLGSISNDATVSSLNILPNSLLFTYHYKCAQCELVTVLLNNPAVWVVW
jgi:hypothetical protein